MSFDIETDLVRELHQVAEGVEVPTMPPLPSDPHSRPTWQPLLVAAAVVLIALAAVAGVLARTGGDDEIQPAPSPSPTVATDGATEGTSTPEPLSTAPPSIPYVVGDRLYVAGQQVAGNDWAWVKGTDTGWVAARFEGGDTTYWWGDSAEPQRIDGFMNQPPTVSPGGGYWAGVLDQGNDGQLTGADTASGGEGFGGIPIDVLVRGVYTSVAAVTDEGLVITGGEGPQTLWRPLVDGQTVDLAQTAPDQVVLGDTEAGLLVVDAASVDNLDGGRYGDVYLADLSADGRITRLGPAPNHDALAAGGSWFSWVEAGATGGELDAIGELRVQRLDGSDPGTLTPPEGWMFRPSAGAWEDNDTLVTVVVEDAGQAERMVRCRPATQECVLLDRP
jgi:hypothetical protein